MDFKARCLQRAFFPFGPGNSTARLKFGPAMLAVLKYSCASLPKLEPARYDFQGAIALICTPLLYVKP